MANINRDYLVVADLKSGKITSPAMSFYNTDKNIANLFVKLQITMRTNPSITCFVNKEEASNYNVKLTVVKPKTTMLVDLVGVIQDSDVMGNGAVYLFDMPQNFTDQVGRYICELEITCMVNGREEVVTCDPFEYVVKESVVTGLNTEIETNPDTPVLKQLIDEVRYLQENGGSIVNLSKYQKIEDDSLDTNNKTVVGGINELNDSKVDKVEGKGLSTIDFTTEKDTKLSGIEDNANNYVHPAKHNADIITQDATHRFVTDAEKEKWNNKSDFSGSYNDLTEKPNIPSIDGLATEVYVENKVASIVNSAPETLDTLNELATALGNDPNFATTVANQIGTKASTEYVNTELAKKVNNEGYVATENNYSTAEKTKLANIEEGANNYIHPENHSASIITQDDMHRFITDAERQAWNNKSDFDGDYNKLSNKPNMPTKVSQIENDSRYTTETYVKNEIANAQLGSGEVDLSGYATKEDLKAKADKSELNNKVDKAEGKGLSTNDLTNDLKTNYDSAYAHSQTSHAPSNAEPNVQSDWNENNASSDAYIKNKPIIPSAYTLPIASTTVLGGVKVGAGLSISNGVLSATSGGTADSVDWNNIQNKPSVFTPATHNHDDVYARKTEIPIVDVTKKYVDTELSKKSPIHEHPYLPNTTKVPTKTSQLQNDSNFATETFVTTKIEEAQLGSSVVSSIYVKCSDIGMTQNDINNNNHQLLCNAINAGNSILVDGEYVLKTENTKLITKNIDIKGITSSARLVLQFDSFTNGIFKVNGNIDISLKNVKFSSVSSTKIINVVNPIGSLGVIEIDGCKFENKVRIFDFVANGSLNPNQNFYGFDTFIFRKNEVTNPTFTAIAIIDAQYNNVIISDNVIRNLGNLFADISINNESVYSNELPSYRRRTTITNNYIKNDSNYSTNNISGSYYCFVVLESDYVYYARNHVEGLKTLQDVVCYDIYASCKEVVSEDNIWKNNLAVLSSSTQHNFGVALMKAKGNNGSRIYRNNTYILEKSFITGMGKTVNDCKVKLFDNTSNTTWKIINNTIDMARLDGQTSGTAANVEFCNNTLRVSNWGNGTITNSGVGCFNIIKDNNVEIKNIITDFQITGCYVKQSEPVLTSYVVTNNVFDITSSKHLYLYDKVSSAKGEICNNTYRCNIIGDFGINYDAEHCNISNLISYGDKWITNKRPRSIYRQLLDINEYSTVIEFTDVLKQESREHLSLKKMKDISDGFNKTYVWTMEYFTSNGWESSTVNFKLEKNGDISKITFVPLGENVPQSFNLFSTQGNSKKFNFSNNIPYIATLSNNSDNPYIYFNHIAGSESSPKHHIIKHNIKALSGGEVRNSNDIKFWKGSQEAYNRLNTKDNSTLYIIIG